MKKLKKADRIIILVFVLIIAAAALLRNIPSVRQKPLIENAAGRKLTYADYNGRKIGILTGTNMEAATFQYFPDSEYLYFDGYPNLNEALSRGIRKEAHQEPDQHRTSAQGISGRDAAP